MVGWAGIDGRCSRAVFSRPKRPRQGRVGGWTNDSEGRNDGLHSASCKDRGYSAVRNREHPAPVRLTGLSLWPVANAATADGAARALLAQLPTAVRRSRALGVGQEIPPEDPERQASWPCSAWACAATESEGARARSACKPTASQKASQKASAAAACTLSRQHASAPCTTHYGTQPPHISSPIFLP